MAIFNTNVITDTPSMNLYELYAYNHDRFNNHLTNFINFFGFSYVSFPILFYGILISFKVNLKLFVFFIVTLFFLIIFSNFFYIIEHPADYFNYIVHIIFFPTAVIFSMAYLKIKHHVSKLKI